MFGTKCVLIVAFVLSTITKSMTRASNTIALSLVAKIRDLWGRRR